MYIHYNKPMLYHEGRELDIEIFPLTLILQTSFFLSKLYCIKNTILSSLFLVGYWSFMFLNIIIHRNVKVCCLVNRNKASEQNEEKT